MLQREHPKQIRRENDQKEILDVLLENTGDGFLLPFKFRTEHGEKFLIDKVINIEPAASLEAGCQGMRYTCRVSIMNEDDRLFEHEIDLYHDGDFWCMEKAQLSALVSCG